MEYAFFTSVFFIAFACGYMLSLRIQDIRISNALKKQETQLKSDHARAIIKAKTEAIAAYQLAKERNTNFMDKDYLKEMAKVVEARLPDNHGFILFAFPFGDGGRKFYASNANRVDAVNALKEWLIMASGEEEWMKHIK